MKKKSSMFCALLLIFAMILTACGTSTETNTKNTAKGSAPTDVSKAESSVVKVIAASDPAKLPDVAKNRKDTLIVGTTAPSGKFNPIYSDSRYDTWVTDLVFDSLLMNDAKGNAIPNVAESWDISKDGKTYTFHLKKGVRFSDGKELTAKDVAFTYNAIADPNYDGPRIDVVLDIVGYDDYHNDKAGKVTNLQGIKVIDDYTISFTFDKANAAALTNNFGYGIMSKDYYGFKKGDTQKLKDLLLKPMGSGAYLFKDYKAGQEIDFEARPDYWKGAPKIKNIIIKVTNADTQIQELTSGGVDVDIVAARPENTKLLQDAGFLNVVHFPANSYGYIGMNLRLDKFSDKKVRQALMYGLNRQGFIDSYFKGYGQPCNAPASPVSWAYTDKLNGYPYDPDKANKLLDEAGWVKKDDGFRYKDGEKFVIHWMTYTGSKYVDTLIPIVKDNWGKLGIEVVPELMEFSTLSTKVYDQQKFELFNMAWTLSIDPDPSEIFSIKQAEKGGFNAGGWDNKESEELIQQGLRETDQKKRKEIYQKWMEVANDDLPYIFLEYSDDLYGVSSRVKNLVVSPYEDWTYHVYQTELVNE